MWEFCKNKYFLHFWKTFRVPLEKLPRTTGWEALIQAIMSDRTRLRSAMIHRRYKYFGFVVCYKTILRNLPKMLFIYVLVTTKKHGIPYFSINCNKTKLANSTIWYLLYNIMTQYWMK